MAVGGVGRFKLSDGIVKKKNVRTGPPSAIVSVMRPLYRVGLAVVDLGLVDFDFYVP